jgi:hypothetical protein
MFEISQIIGLLEIAGADVNEKLDFLKINSPKLSLDTAPVQGPDNVLHRDDFRVDFHILLDVQICRVTI